MNEFNDLLLAEQLMIDSLSGQISELEEYVLNTLLKDNPALVVLWNDLLTTYLAYQLRVFEESYEADGSYQKLITKYERAITRKRTRLLQFLLGRKK